MERWIRKSAIAATAVLASSFLFAGSAVGGAEVTEGRGDGEIPRVEVRIRNWSLQPQVIQIEHGQELGWRNRASSEAKVVFEREAARAMVCHHAHGLKLEGAELTSTVPTGGQLGSGCTLGPGEYRYQVVFHPEKGGNGAPLGGRSLTGRVIVQ